MAFKDKQEYSQGTRKLTACSLLHVFAAFSAGNLIVLLSLLCRTYVTRFQFLGAVVHSLQFRYNVAGVCHY
jgi:hypothetical protein